MDFEWDENKNAINMAKHKIDFADAVHIFLDNNRIEREDYRVDYGEQRFQTIGSSEYGILFVIYTEREPDGTIRLISARKANKQEKNYYHKGKFLQAL